MAASVMLVHHFCFQIFVYQDLNIVVPCIDYSCLRFKHSFLAKKRFIWTAMYTFEGYFQSTVIQGRLLKFECHSKHFKK